MKRDEKNVNTEFSDYKNGNTPMKIMQNTLKYKKYFNKT